jgi:hypothetical protein
MGKRIMNCLPHFFFFSLIQDHLVVGMLTALFKGWMFHGSISNDYCGLSYSMFGAGNFEVQL